MRRLPTWLKIALPIALLLLLLAAAALRILLDTVPAHAGPEVIQARFPEQIDALRELAGLLPSGCEEVEPDETSPGDPVRKVHALTDWWQAAESRQAIFTDPVILGAEVVRYCGDSVLSSGVKSYEGPAASWSRSMFLPAREWPAVSLWHAGSRRLIEYEDHLPGKTKNVTGYRLTLDLDVLESVE